MLYSRVANLIGSSAVSGAGAGIEDVNVGAAGNRRCSYYMVNTAVVGVNCNCNCNLAFFQVVAMVTVHCSYDCIHHVTI